MKRTETEKLILNMKELNVLCDLRDFCEEHSTCKGCALSKSCSKYLGDGITMCDFLDGFIEDNDKVEIEIEMEMEEND